MSSHREARNITFRQQVNITERVPLGTLPLEVVMSLAHNHVQISLSLVTKGLLLSSLGSKSNSMIEVQKIHLH